MKVRETFAMLARLPNAQQLLRVIEHMDVMPDELPNGQTAVWRDLSTTLSVDDAGDYTIHEVNAHDRSFSRTIPGDEMAELVSQTLAFRKRRNQGRRR